MLYYDFLQNSRKITTKWVHYFPIYEKHFKRFVNQSVTFWEIGVYKGGSLQMWKRYFGPFARIIGIDIDPECKAHEEDQINICIGDQSDTAFLQSVIDKYGYPDIVLDDGSHIAEHTCQTFNFLYDKVNKNGIYMIEDLHTAYYNSFGGGLNRKGTFIELCKSLIDYLNARHCDLPLSFAENTYSMSFYDSIVAFEKTAWGANSLKSMISSAQGTINQLYLPIDYKKIKDKSILLFGAGKIGCYNKNLLGNYGIKVDYFIDNDKYKQGKYIEGVEVIAPEKSIEIENTLFIISTAFNLVINIYTQLKEINVPDKSIFIISNFAS